MYIPQEIALNISLFSGEVFPGLEWSTLRDEMISLRIEDYYNNLINVTIDPDITQLLQYVCDPPEVSQYLEIYSLQSRVDWTKVLQFLHDHRIVHHISTRSDTYVAMILGDLYDDVLSIIPRGFALNNTELGDYLIIPRVNMREFIRQYILYQSRIGVMHNSHRHNFSFIEHEHQDTSDSDDYGVRKMEVDTFRELSTSERSGKIPREAILRMILDCQMKMRFCDELISKITKTGSILEHQLMGHMISTSTSITVTYTDRGVVLHCYPSEGYNRLAQLMKAICPKMRYLRCKCSMSCYHVRIEGDQGIKLAGDLRLIQSLHSPLSTKLIPTDRDTNIKQYLPYSSKRL
uniref:Uncharacterized protein n=1 Tax=viral metagenome TaxID=1070528 RepID=A0A6C0BKZ0_9ZZZZ